MRITRVRGEGIGVVYNRSDSNLAHCPTHERKLGRVESARVADTSRVEHGLKLQCPTRVKSLTSSKNPSTLALPFESVTNVLYPESIVDEGNPSRNSFRTKLGDWN